MLMKDLVVGLAVASVVVMAAAVVMVAVPAMVVDRMTFEGVLLQGF